jgi:uncharacterized membrane protein YozB (DUF420 family)
MNLPEPLTLEQLATFTGQVAATYVITLAIRSIAPIPVKPLAFFVALVLAFVVGLSQHQTTPTPSEIVLTLVNGLLVYLTVLGASDSVPQRDRLSGLKLQ